MDTEEHVESTALVVVLATPDDSTFEVLPLPTVLQLRKGSLKMMLSGVSNTINNLNKLDRLVSCYYVVNIAFSSNSAPLDVRSLRAAFDEFLTYLETVVSFRNQSPIALFEHDVEWRLSCLRAQLERKRQELDALVTAQNEIIVAMEKLLNNIERTHLILVDLEQLYILQ